LGLAAWAATARTEEGPKDEAAKEPEVAPLSVVAYRVDDLLNRYRDWTARQLGLNDVLEGGVPTAGGIPPGLFGVAPGAAAAAPEPEMGSQELLDIVQKMVNQQSNPKVAAWDSEGGIAHIDFLKVGGALELIVSQTPEGQRSMELLLESLRRATEVGGPMVMIHVTWLEVTDAKAAELLGGDPAKRQVPMEVTAATLAKADAKTLYRACTTCFNGQQVCALSGNLRSYVGEATPIVCEALVGWSPTIRNLIVGGVLEVRPQLSRDKDTVLLDYRSYVNQTATMEHKLTKVSSSTTGGMEGTTAEIDLPAVDCQSLRGSVRIPVGKTILLGCTTGPKLKDGKVACLVVEVSVSADGEATKTLVETGAVPPAAATKTSEPKPARTRAPLPPAVPSKGSKKGGGN
jgi:hypothetical protein